MPQKKLITGGAGFIGSHIADRLIGGQQDVVVYDNLSNGHIRNLKPHTDRQGFNFIEGDLLDIERLNDAIEDVDIVYHLAANPEVRLGLTDTRAHLEQNVLATFNLLEAMRMNEIKYIVFTSTSTVYGVARELPTPENYGPLMPVSLYGASKLACEALITAYCNNYDIKCWIFRFANIVGSRSNHGVVYDFVNKLKADPAKLEILGDGTQKKSYLHVSDCVDAMMFAIEKADEQMNIFNIGSKDWIDVIHIAEFVCKAIGLEGVEFSFTGGSIGWKGDVPKMMLSIELIERLGWSPRLNSRESIAQTAEELLSG